MDRLQPESFDKVIDRCGTHSEKWFMYEQRSVLPFWLADMDFPSPRAVIEALKSRVEHGVFGYTRIPRGLVEAVLEMLETTYHWKISPEWLLWLPGLVTGLNVACRAVGEQGDDVLTLIPVYPPFLTAPGNFKRKVVTVPLVLQGGRWGFDPAQIEEAITPRTRLMLLCSPHNPVGRVYDQGELLALAEICARHDLVICSDEIHCALVLDQDKRHIPTATLAPEISDRTITLMAPSKTYNLPGLGCAFAVIPNTALRKRFRQAMAGIVPHVNVMGLVAAEAAYRHGGEWLGGLLEYLRHNRDLVIARVNTMPGLMTTHVEATYLAWIDARETGITEPARFFEQAGVGLGNGRAFGAPGFLRLTFGCPRVLLEEALNRMERALSSWL